MAKVKFIQDDKQDIVTIITPNNEKLIFSITDFRVMVNYCPETTFSTKFTKEQWRVSMVRDIRAQVSMVFHLDKCIGCHTCSVACKNIWTDRKGTEYMWWNNVETKPGTGYPTLWEDQDKYKGGWEKDANGDVKVKLQDEVGAK